jgi:hypothetical protein
MRTSLLSSSGDEDDGIGWLDAALGLGIICEVANLVGESRWKGDGKLSCLRLLTAADLIDGCRESSVPNRGSFFTWPNDFCSTLGCFDGDLKTLL